MDLMIMDRYFRQLNERGRVVITFDDKDFLEVFIKSCREKIYLLEATKGNTILK